MTDENTPAPEEAEEPKTSDLKEPSTEKEPGEEPKAPAPPKEEPSHEAIGIGVVDTPAESHDA